MLRRLLLMLLAVGLVLGAIFGWKAFVGMQMGASMAAMAMPPVTVSTARAVAEPWVPTLPAVGTLRAVKGVDVTPQMGGIVTELLFESGDRVKAGALLVRQYSADDSARLEGLRADTELAEMNLRRAEDLADRDLISAFDLDTRRADLKRARALEDNLRLTIEQRAIRAPFAGRLGIRRVDVGQYVEPGDQIVRLEDTSQLLVEFPVPQRWIAEVEAGREIEVRTDAFPGTVFEGSIRAAEARVDSETRMLRVEAVVENPEGRLVPGMFAQISLELPARGDVVTVPQAAVTYSPYGNSVFVVEPGDGRDGEGVYTVRNSFVTTGATRGDQVAVESGLAAGTTVVTAGQQKLRNDVRVRIDNSVPVSNQPDPTPENN